MGLSYGFPAVSTRYSSVILGRFIEMISWTSVMVTLSLTFMIYFLIKGIRMALTSKDLPDPEEGDYEIKVVGKLKGGKLLTVMSPRKPDPKAVDA